MRGLVQLQNTLQMIRENLNPDVEIEGILPTMLDSRVPRQGGRGDPRGELRRPGLPVADQEGDQVRRSAVRGSSVLKYDPQGSAAKYYRALAEEVPDPRLKARQHARGPPRRPVPLHRRVGARRGDPRHGHRRRRLRCRSRSGRGDHRRAHSEPATGEQGTTEQHLVEEHDRSRPRRGCARRGAPPRSPPAEEPPPARR